MQRVQQLLLGPEMGQKQLLRADASSEKPVHHRVNLLMREEGSLLEQLYTFTCRVMNRASAT